MPSQLSPSFRPRDASPLVALQTDGGAEMPEDCSLARSTQGTYIAGFAHPRECTVLNVPPYLHGVSCLLLLLRDRKASSILSAAFQSKLVHGVAGLRSRIRRLLSGGNRIGSTASLRVQQVIEDAKSGLWRRSSWALSKPRWRWSLMGVLPRCRHAC